MGNKKLFIFIILCVIAYGVLVFFALSGCSSAPEILTDNDGNVIECQQCYHWRLCVDVARKTGQPVSGCSYESCERMLIYLECEKIKDPVEKQNCWIKLK